MENQSAPTVTPPPAAAKQPGKKTWPMLLLGLVVGAAIVGGAWYFWPSSTKAATTPTTSTAKTTTKQPSPPAATTVACSSSDLSMAAGTSDGTAGTQYQHIVVTNTGSSTCKLAGYPAVFLLDSTGNALGNGAGPAATPAPTTISLAAGAKAYVAVGFPDAGNFNSGTCTATSKTLRLYLPGTASYLDTDLSQADCPGFSTTAFAPGS